MIEAEEEMSFEASGAKLSSWGIDCGQGRLGGTGEEVAD